MPLFPFKFEEINNNKILITNEAGDFFFCNGDGLKKLINKNYDEHFLSFLQNKGFFYEEENDLSWNSFKYKIHKRKRIKKKIAYIMIIPTLRCNLKCSYCQVSRVDENTKGYDWSKETVKDFIQFLDDYEVDELKLEFQGGEPSLRCDIINEIITEIDKTRPNTEYVICTNLQNLNDEFKKIIDHERVYISTSIDGDIDIQKKQRTASNELAKKFFSNLEYVLKKYGTSKISALPTFTDFDEVPKTIDSYVKYGFKHIFLRPVNFQGFARKKFPNSKNQEEVWTKAYSSALDYIFDLNFSQKGKILEYSFETILKRIFHLNHNGFVDLRTPNFSIQDNIIIDYDGKFYPTDEARMITRIGSVDLSVGSLDDGMNSNKVNEINWDQMNEINPDCIHCVHQSYCGIDLIDDLSRYSRIDKPKYETAFCQKHIYRFNDAFKRIMSLNKKDIYNINGHLTRNFNINPPFGQIYYDTFN